MKKTVLIATLIAAGIFTAGCQKSDIELTAERQKADYEAQVKADQIKHEIVDAKVKSGAIDKVSVATLEMYRAQSKKNARILATEYIGANKRFTGNTSLVGRADTMIKEDCPQGSGWIKWTLQTTDPKATDGSFKTNTLYCSTWSEGIGCFLGQDKDNSIAQPFEKTDYASEPQKCKSKSDMIYPLPDFSAASAAK